MRKRWPNQVRTLKGMKVGYTYIKVYSHLGYRERGLKFISMAEYSNLGKGFMRLKFERSDGRIVYHFAADSNLCRYNGKDGLWNSSNYFVRERRRS